jgi:putative protease
MTGHSQNNRSQYVGVVLAVDAEGGALVDVKNHFAVGDRLEIIHPSGNREVKLTSMTRDGMDCSVAPGNGIQVRIPDMAGTQGAMIARLL